MNLDYEKVPAGHKTNRRRGWRVGLLRRLAQSQRSFTARDLADLSDGAISLNHAHSICVYYFRRGELLRVRKGVRAFNPKDRVQSRYARAT